MPAAPVADPPWLTGTWSDTAWEENTWGFLAAGANDLTTLFVPYVESRLDTENRAIPDAPGAVVRHQGTVRAAVSSDDDLNTAYWTYLQL